MSKPKKTLAAVVAALFPKSEQVISETLATDQFNAFAEDAQEIQNRLDAQAEGNAAMNADLTAANDAANAAEASLNAAQARIADLEVQVTELTALKAELTVFGETAEARSTFKAQADLAIRQADALRGAGVPPVADASTTDDDGAKSYELAPWNKHLNRA